MDLFMKFAPTKLMHQCNGNKGCEDFHLFISSSGIQWFLANFASFVAVFQDLVDLTTAALLECTWIFYIWNCKN